MPLALRPFGFTLTQRLFSEIRSITAILVLFKTYYSVLVLIVMVFLHKLIADEFKVV